MSLGDISLYLSCLGFTELFESAGWCFSSVLEMAWLILFKYCFCLILSLHSKSLITYTWELFTVSCISLPLFCCFQFFDLCFSWTFFINLSLTYIFLYQIYYDSHSMGYYISRFFSSRILILFFLIDAKSLGPVSIACFFSWFSIVLLHIGLVTTSYLMWPLLIDKPFTGLQVFIM